MNLCITGYRPDKMPEQYGYDIHNAAWKELKRAFCDVSLFLYARYGYRLTVYTGMALGVDQAIAEATFELRNELPDIRIIAAVPCYNYEVKWPIQSRKLYHSILERCDQVTYVTRTSYTADCLEKRNRYMVDHSALVLGIYDGKKGGTKNCLDYARKNGKQIITIRPHTLQVYASFPIGDVL